jgi:hypothetical protein
MNHIPELPLRKRKEISYKKPESIKMLERMMIDKYKKEHPTLPPFPYKFRDDKANDLTFCITCYLTLKGAFVSRINNQGTYNVKLKRYIPSTSRKGIADVMAVLDGNALNIEIKIGRDRQSEDQKKVEADVIRSGGYYFIARDFTSFVIYIDSLNKTI